MPIAAIIFGILLIAVGLGGYFGTNTTSPTALIPAAFGSLLGLLGILTLMRPNLRKHAMHAAAAIGLVGFVVPAIRALPKLPTLISEGKVVVENKDLTNAVVAQLLMALLCLVFVGLCINSFVAARRRRLQSQEGPHP